MFKLSVPITKTVKQGNKLVVEGIASDPTIDRDSERFSEKAIEKMCKSINEGNVQIRVEHENKFYTKVGIWKEASVDKDYRLHVKGEIDTELSLGKDVEVLLNRGEKLELSVGGRVLEAVWEYAKEVERNIKVYKDVVLEEISILLTPSNYNTSLSVAKSVDWNKIPENGTEKSVEQPKGVPYTTQAQKLIQLHKAMEKATSSLAVKPKLDVPAEKKEKGECKPLEIKKGSAMEAWINKVSPKIDKLMKDIYVDSDEGWAEPSLGLTTEDLHAIAQITTIMSQVDLPSDDEVMDMFESETYQTTVESLGEDGFIILSDRMLVMPHHNEDYTVNKDWLLIQLKRLMDNRSFWKPKDYTIAVSHLYNHLKELSIVKSTNKSPNSNAMKLTPAEVDLLQQAYDFHKGVSKIAPILSNGEKMNKEQIGKCVEAYEKLVKSPNFNYLLNNHLSMDPKKIKKEEGVEPETPKVEEETPVVETPAVEEPVVETPAEEPVVETPVVEEPVVEKPTEEPTEPEAEVPVTPVEEPVVETPVAEAPVAEEPVVETPAEEVDPQKSAPVAKQGFTKAFEDKVEKRVLGVERNVSTVADLVNGLVEKTKGLESLEKAVTQMSLIVEKLAKAPLGRKSVASYEILEKAMTGQDAQANSFEEAVQKKIDVDKMSFTEAYRTVKLEMATPQA